VTTSVSPLRITATDLGPWPVRSRSKVAAASAICRALIIGPLPGGRRRATASEKKAGVVERPGVFDHAGILVDGPPGTAGLPFT
jgi:hypothetical protein